MARTVGFAAAGTWRRVPTAAARYLGPGVLFSRLEHRAARGARETEHRRSRRQGVGDMQHPTHPPP